MRPLISFFILGFIKILSHVLFRFKIKWLSQQRDHWDEVRLLVFLNHTSLWEPLYVGVPPFSFIARIAKRMVAPGADKTLNRPLVGKFWKIMGPGLVSISRKRDKTWTSFMDSIHKDSVIVIAPEGRMKRANGLDLEGNPMTVRGGVADILNRLDQGKMLIAYSAGLHHVQVPGQKLPRFFKTLKMNLELMDISDYKKKFSDESGKEWKKQVVADMQRRLESNCPKAY